MSESAGRLPVQLPRQGAARLSTDDSLARRAAQGDERAFAAIYKRHHQELYRYCRAILRNPDDAQDALQATMVKALRALPGEEREIALKPWLFRVAHNEAISIARARQSPAALDPEAPDPLAAPEQEAATRERLRQLVTDLDSLPDRQRGSLVMRELSGLSFEEIGRVFDFSPAAAKQAVYEARVALQEIAEGREMECDLVREAISAQDRRVLRGRRIRAHLRGCERCSDFEAAIGRRSSDMALIAPPIAAPAAVATLQAVLGGTAAGGAAAGAGAIGAGLAGGVALKTAVAVVAVAALAGGTAELTGVVDIGGSPKADKAAPAAAPATAPGAEEPAPAAPSAEPAASSGSQGGRGNGQADGGRGHRHGNADGRGHGHGQATAPGQAETSPGQSGTAGSSASAPGQTGATPGQSGSAGNSANAPGHTGSAGNSANAPGQSSSSPGQGGSTPGQSGTAGNSGSNGAQGASSNASANGQAHGGGTSTAPGQTDTAPGQGGTAGNSGDAPGHQD